MVLPNPISSPRIPPACWQCNSHSHLTPVCWYLQQQTPTRKRKWQMVNKTDKQTKACYFLPKGRERSNLVRQTLLDNYCVISAKYPQKKSCGCILTHASKGNMGSLYFHPDCNKVPQAPSSQTSPAPCHVCVRKD